MKDKRITIWMSQEDFETIIDAARRSSESVSSFLRRLGLQHARNGE